MAEVEIESRESTIEIPGYRIACLEWGDPDAPPLLGVHGRLDNAATFAPLAPYLRDFRLVSIDLPGHGKSSHSPPGHLYYFFDLACVIFDVADALGWEGFSVLSHSGGAIAAFVAAATEPGRIRTLFAVDGLGPVPTTPPEETAARFQKVYDDRRRLLENDNPTFGDRDTALAVRAKISRIDREKTEAGGAMLSRDIVETGHGEWGFRFDPILRAAYCTCVTLEQARAYLGEVDIPAKMVRATGESGNYPDVRKRWASAIDHLELQDMEGGHHVHLERAAEVGGAAREFFRKHLGM